MLKVARARLKALVPDRPADWSWDCRYWMAANGIDDSAAFDRAWANPKEELHLNPGAIVRKTTDPSWGQKIEIWYQWDEPKKPQPTVTVERIS